MTIRLTLRRLVVIPTLALTATVGWTHLTVTGFGAAVLAPSLQGAWRLTETAVRAPGGVWEARPSPQAGLFVFTARHYSYFYVPGVERRVPFVKPNQPTDAERAVAYSSFIAGAGSYSMDGSTLALKADFRKNPNEMTGDIWRVQAELRRDTLQLLYVDPPFLPGREYRLLLLRVE